jgi:hypothetical protein
MMRVRFDSTTHKVSAWGDALALDANTHEFDRNYPPAWQISDASSYAEWRRTGSAGAYKLLPPNDSAPYALETKGSQDDAPSDEAPEETSGGSRPFIEETETGIVANRASGFQSAWETFDLLEPGVGYGSAVFTAADGDGLTWGTDIAPAQIVEVSADAATWVAAYTLASAGTWVALIDTSAAQASDLVGKGLAYTLFTPRAIRFRCAIQDLNTGLVYAGGDDPSFVFDFTYTAS